MAEITTEEVKTYLSQHQGKEITLSDLRREFNLLPGSKSFDAIRSILFRLTEQRIIVPTGRRSGTYKIVTQVEPVRVFLPGRERRPPIELIFPRDFERGVEMDFAEAVVIREGDLITLGGVKSKGKTLLCLSFAAENIDKHPVLMGNEYTVLVSDKMAGTNPAKPRYEPAPRFLNRLDKMAEWVEWVDAEGYEKFTLLPVRGDYAEHIVKDRINIIDWINLDGNVLYDIGKVLEGIKANLGRGVGIVALQKGEGALNPRGGQFVRDFSDLELLLDGFGDNDDNILLTIKGTKEKTKPIVGNTYAYTIVEGGTQIINFREVAKCPACHGQGFGKGGKCDSCHGNKFIDK